MPTVYRTKAEILSRANVILNKSLRQIISTDEIKEIEIKIGKYGLKRKGFLGNLIEEYVFGIKPNNISGPDFPDAGIELKTTPLKLDTKKGFTSKERLVFSQINYQNIINESWDTSGFIKKNKFILLVFYLWTENQSILDYEIKFVYPLDFLEDVLSGDLFQIRKDWEYIVAKIRRGEAHLLSESDTYYLGACTRAANAESVTQQPMNDRMAKPRAFSLKQQYINYLIQTRLLGKISSTASIFQKLRRIESIEDAVRERFSRFIRKSENQIISELGLNIKNKSKNHLRIIVNHIFGGNSNKIEELEKSNVTVKAINVEHNGKLKESISFPVFEYKELIKQNWEPNEDGEMADFHSQLETKKFLFIVFQKQEDSKDIILKKTMFWNFPMKDIGEAESVWKKTIDCIKVGKYTKFPKISESTVAHVRPHGKNSKDTIETPQKTQEMKRCFWLNAKYIQQAISLDKN